MIYSMTGFARAQNQGEWGSIVWELRSVNHRYLDISLRLPDSFRALENNIREILRGKLSRGKVEASLKFSPGPGLSSEIELNEQLLQQLSNANSTIGNRFDYTITVNPLEVLRWPGIVKEKSDQYSSVYEFILSTFNDGVDKLKSMRGKEGEAIYTMISERLDKIEKLVDEVNQIQPEIKKQYRQNILEKLQEVSDKLDSDRLEQEMIYFAQRVDVSEELDRLNAHVKELRKVLKRNEQIGRRLDFFMQELNREANTLSSKSQNNFQTHSAVEIKVLIEQMREQVQNIE